MLVRCFDEFKDILIVRSSWTSEIPQPLRNLKTKMEFDLCI